jgi:type IV secretion system protein VirD4
MRYCRRILIVSVLAFAASLAVLTYKAPFGGFLLAAVGLAALCVSRKNRERLTACGSARWATNEDMQAAGMLSGKPGLIIGTAYVPGGSLPNALKRLFDSRVPDWEACHAFVKTLRNRRKEEAPITLSNVCHTAIFAPTGAGKGQSCILPFLKVSPGSCVVIDPKGENYRETAAIRRQRFDHRTVKLDPFGVCGPGSDTFNPLDAIDRHSPLLIDECAALASAIVVRTGDEKDPFWNNSAELWIKAMCVAVALWGDKDRSLQAVRTLLTDPTKRALIIKAMCESKELGGMVARLGNELLNFQQKELGSVLSVVSTFMTFLDTPPVAANTQVSSFDPGDLNKGKLSVYLVLPPEHIKTQSPLMRLWVGSLLKAVLRGGLQEKNLVTFVLDEAATLGRMEAISNALFVYRGYGVRLQLYYQTLSQLKECWGEGGDQSVLSNCSQVFFAVQDNATANYISERLGEQTIVVMSGGTNNGGSRQTSSQDSNVSTGINWGDSSNWSQQARRLLKPEEIATLPRRMAISFIPELPPIISHLTCDYEGEPVLRGNVRWSKARVWASALSLLAMSAATAALVAMIQVTR